MHLRRTLLAVGAALLVGGLAVPSIAQPKHPKAKAAKEKAKERREERKEKREELKEKHKELKEKHKELKEKFKERKARHNELKKKEEAGELTDDEKEELGKMKKRHARLKARHQKLKERHAELRKTWKKRRRAARRKILQKYPNIRKKPKAVTEMKVHARRMARLKRARAIAEAEERDDLVKKIDSLITKEQARHQRKIDAHTKGGS